MIKRLILIVILTPAPALAGEPAFIGAWAPSAKGCKAEDSATFLVTPKGIEGREWGCEIKRASSDGAGWLVHLSCAGEGSEYARTLHWRLAPNGRLQERENGQSREYVRCKASDYRPT